MPFLPFALLAFRVAGCGSGCDFASTSSPESYVKVKVVANLVNKGLVFRLDCLPVNGCNRSPGRCCPVLVPGPLESSLQQHKHVTYSCTVLFKAACSNLNSSPTAVERERKDYAARLSIKESLG